MKWIEHHFRQYSNKSTLFPKFDTLLLSFAIDIINSIKNIATM